MGATRSLYNDKVIEARSTNGLTIPHWFAKLHIDKATHMARFYLDELLANVDASGVKGHLGICQNGSANYQMHAAARRGCIGATIGAAHGIAFQDGGLNTFGILISQTAIDRTAMGATVSNDYKSAYCVKTTKTGVTYRMQKPGEAWSLWFTEESTKSRLPNETFATEFRLTQLTTFTASEGTQIEFYGWIENEEGRYTTSVIASTTIILSPIKLRANSTANQVLTYWTNNPAMHTVGNAGIDSATKLYREVSPESYTPEASGNYYHETANTLYYTFGTSGSFTNALLSETSTNTGGQGTTYNTEIWDSYGSSSTQACIKSEIGPSITTYRSLSNGKYYSSPTMGAYAPDYYYTRIQGGLYEIVQMVSGEIVSSGNYC